MPGDAGAAFWNAYNQSRTRRLHEQAFAEESAIRQLQRQRLQEQLASEQSLPQDISAVLRASQGGTVPVLAGSQTPAAPEDLSDLAGQNLLDLKQTRAAQTLPQLAEAVPANVLARVIQHRPQVFNNLGLQTPQAVEKASQQKAGRQKIAGILSETPTTPEETSRWWDRITGAWVEHGLDKADDVLEARMRMKGLPPDESAKATAFFLTTRNAYRQAGHDDETAFASAVNDTATAFPRGGGVLKELAEKFKPGAPAKPQIHFGQRGEVLSVTPGEPGVTTLRPGETDEQAAARIKAEEKAKTEGRRAGESPDERRIREAYLKAKADYLDSMRQGKPRNLQTVTGDIATFERILKTMPTPQDIAEMEEVDKAEAESRRQGVTAILSELYQEHEGLRRQRPMPGRERVPPVSNPSDTGTSRPVQAPTPTDLGPSQASAPKLAPTEDNRARIVSIVKRLFPNKLYSQLTPAEKQKVAAELAKGQ